MVRISGALSGANDFELRTGLEEVPYPTSIKETVIWRLNGLIFAFRDNAVSESSPRDKRLVWVSYKSPLAKSQKVGRGQRVVAGSPRCSSGSQTLGRAC